MRAAKAIGLMLMTSCYSVHLIKVNGIEVDQGTWELNQGLVRNRAAFDLKCDRSALAMTLLNGGAGDSTLPWQVGVEGCGQSAVYIWNRSSGWVMNGGAR
jgi:hypothetical protein